MERSAPKVLLTLRDVRDDFLEAARVRVVAASERVPMVMVAAFLGRVDVVWILERGGDCFLVDSFYV